MEVLAIENSENSATSPLGRLYTHWKVLQSRKSEFPREPNSTPRQEGNIPHPVFPLLPALLFLFFFQSLLVPDHYRQDREEEEGDYQYGTDSSGDLRIEYPREQCQYEDRYADDEADHG